MVRDTWLRMSGRLYLRGGPIWIWHGLECSHGVVPALVKVLEFEVGMEP